VNRVHRLIILVLLPLVTLLATPVAPSAVPAFQGDPASQCAEGVGLFFNNKMTEAFPLLEAGFAGRAGALFNSPDDLGKCALALGVLRYEAGELTTALEAFAVASNIFQKSSNWGFAGASSNNTGEIYVRQQRYADALDAYQQALLFRRKVGDRSGEVLTLNGIGQIYYQQGRYTDASEAFLQSVQIARALGDRARESTSLINLGASYIKQGRPTEALIYLQQALTIARENDDRAGEARALNTIGGAYGSQGRYTEALDAYQQALDIRRAINDSAGQSISLVNLGTSYLEQARYTEALAYLQQALPLLRALNDRTGEATALNSIGAIYNKQRHFPEALDAYQQALALVHASGDRASESITLNNIGDMYKEQGRYDDAIRNYQQALALSRAVGDRVTEATVLDSFGDLNVLQGHYDEAMAMFQNELSIVRALGDRLGEGTTLNAIGEVYRAQKQLSAALESYEHALAIERAVNDRTGEATTLGNISAVYMDQGRYAEALQNDLQALSIQQTIKDATGQARTLNDIGLIYQYQGFHEEALNVLQQALTIWRTERDKFGEATTLNNMGLAYHAQGRDSDALNAHQQAQSIRRALGDRAGEADSLGNIGSIYHDQNRLDDALQAYQQALAIERTIGNGIREGIMLNNIGLLYQQEGKALVALTQYEQAMDAFESIRAVAGSDKGRTSFIAQWADLYARVIELYHTQGQDDRAFLASERSRARAFLDSLATGQVQLQNQDAEELLAHEQQLYQARQAAQTALFRARAVSKTDASLIATLEKQYAEVDKQYTEVLDTIEKRGDQITLLAQGRTKHVLDVTTVQQQIDPQTTLVSFFVTHNQTFVFLVNHDRFQTISLSIGDATLRDEIHALLNAPTFQNDAHPIEAISLYNSLIVPLKPYLTTRHLAIVPHGVLHYLPFAELGDGRHFMIDDYVLTLLPSASTLPYIKANTGHSLTTPLVLGNSDGTLPFATHEAQVVAELFGTVPLVGAQATKRALRAQMSQAGILHIAVHGRYDPTNPLDSLLALAPDGSDNGHLSAGEVYGLDLHKTDLAVLSACETNLGKVSTGDEVVGLTRAFFFAGTPTVVSSLWSVDDAATSLLMERFYTHLRAGMGKAEALRQAQIDVRAQYPAPYYWAGFVLAGDAGAMPSEVGSLGGAIGAILAIAMVGLAGALLWLQRRLEPEWRI
jgi:CHAT domain-containing protein/Tfp pilus assembly protein PilF